MVRLLDTLLLGLLIHSASSARIEDLFGDLPEPQPFGAPLAPLNLSGLVWQPLRASFRPLNRPVAPEPLNAEPPTTTTTPSPNFDDEDRPTRLPLNRFRPTRAPSVDPPVELGASQPLVAATSWSQLGSNGSQSSTTSDRISSECFECICEATTNCNSNSRCQTSDVRHTRCGLFLINYDQWLETGLSRELVTSDMLARDPAADERAFYGCVTNRKCAERLLSIYLPQRSLDCNKDGHIDCYDWAAIHQAGRDQCASEVFLESQYWNDFNACYGFGR